MMYFSHQYSGQRERFLWYLW